MEGQCPVCSAKCVQGARVCAVCNFADELGINRIWVNIDDGEYWLATVVKPYRQKWESDKREAVLRAELELTRKKESFLAARIKEMEAALNEKSKVPIPNVSDIISFGGYEWRVLEVQGNQALLLSDIVLEKSAYNKSDSDITWEHCTLRQYLNNDFYNKLPAAYRNRIVQKSIPNNDNPWFNKRGGSKTSDKVFLLSVEELIKYLGSGDLERYWGISGMISRLRKANWVDDEHNNKRIANDASGMASWWWLRSPGFHSYLAAYVNADGRVDISGRRVSAGSGGIRPALWLNLD